MSTVEISMFLKRNVVRIFVVFSAGIVCLAFTDARISRDWPLAGSLAVVLYLFVAISLWIIHGISRWIYIELFFESDMVSRILLVMRHAKVPSPKRHHPKDRQYFSRLANDEYAETSDRLKAGMILAAIEANKATMGGHERQAFGKAIDLAVHHYHFENPCEDSADWWS